VSTSFGINAPRRILWALASGLVGMVRISGTPGHVVFGAGAGRQGPKDVLCQKRGGLRGEKRLAKGGTEKAGPQPVAVGTGERFFTSEGNRKAPGNKRKSRYDPPPPTTNAHPNKNHHTLHPTPNKNPQPPRNVFCRDCFSLLCRGG